MLMLHSTVRCDLRPLRQLPQQLAVQPPLPLLESMRLTRQMQRAIDCTLQTSQQLLHEREQLPCSSQLSLLPSGC